MCPMARAWNCPNSSTPSHLAYGRCTLLLRTTYQSMSPKGERAKLSLIQMLTSFALSWSQSPWIYSLHTPTFTVSRDLLKKLEPHQEDVA